MYNHHILQVTSYDLEKVPRIDLEKLKGEKKYTNSTYKRNGIKDQEIGKGQSL